MSMTSKVNPILRQEIVDYLAQTAATNQGLVSTFGNRYSLRTIQEATQKMTRDNTLVKRISWFTGATIYSLNTSVPQQTSAAVAV